jgi:hypothetical protein
MPLEKTPTPAQIRTGLAELENLALALHPAPPHTDIIPARIGKRS